MKKILLLSILGVVANVAPLSSSATGYVYFDNYSSNFSMPVRYLGADLMTSDVRVDLFYHLGITTDPNQMTDLNLSQPISFYILDSSGAEGFFFGGIVTIPGYNPPLAGPITFMVRGWDAATGATYATASTRGQSFLWRESSLVTNPTFPPFNFQGFPGPDGAPLLVLVPEPSALAITGLAALLVAVRRHALNGSN